MKPLTIPGDSLKLIRYLTLDFLALISVKVVFFATLSFHLILVSIQIYLFAKNPNLDFLLRNSIPFFPIVFESSIMVLLYSEERDLKELCKKFESICLSKDRCSGRVKNLIAFESKNIIEFILISNFCAIICGFLFLFHEEEKYDRYLALEVLQNHLNHPILSKSCTTLYRLTLLILVNSTVIASGLIAYFGYHLVFQLYICNDYLGIISRIGVVDEKSDVDLVHDEKYQKQIEKRLKFCFNHVLELKKLTDETRKIIAPNVMSLGFFGVAHFVTLTLNIYMGRFYFRTLFTYVLSSAAILIIPYIGQRIEDNNGKMLDVLLRRNRWHLWNHSNRRFLLMFIQVLLKPSRIYFTEELGLNYEMAVKFVRFCYSVLSLFLRRQVFEKLQRIQ